jgi:predicted PhzF superfamily epimerase YddE/YHI9
LGNPEILEVYRNRDILVELKDEETVSDLSPDFSLLKKIPGMVIVTARGKSVDFVSRFFAPTAGIDEDPVTGSAHSQLIPYWSNKLVKEVMVAKQLSKRGGLVFCELNGDRVVMGGNCVPYLKGKITL